MESNFEEFQRDSRLTQYGYMLLPCAKFDGHLSRRTCLAKDTSTCERRTGRRSSVAAAAAPTYTPRMRSAAAIRRPGRLCVYLLQRSSKNLACRSCPHSNPKRRLHNLRITGCLAGAHVPPAHPPTHARTHTRRTPVLLRLPEMNTAAIKLGGSP